MKVCRGVAIRVQRIDQLHDGTDGCVEIEAVGNIFRYLSNGSVQCAPQFLGLYVQSRRIIGFWRFFGRFRKVSDDTPQAVEEAGSALHALVAPLQITLRRRRKKNEETGGIRTVFFDDFFRGYNIAFGLGHLRAIFNHHALGQQVFERLVSVDETCVLENLGKEPRI